MYIVCTNDIIQVRICSMYVCSLIYFTGKRDRQRQNYALRGRRKRGHRGIEGEHNTRRTIYVCAYRFVYISIYASSYIYMGEK